MAITHVEAEVSNEAGMAPGPVVLGEAQDAALLGTVTLQSMGLVLDPFQRALRPARLRLAAVGSPAASA